MVALLGYSREQIRAAVCDMYSQVARAPTSGFHFPVGRQIAEALGYPPARLQGLPEATLRAFAGVGYPFRAEAVRPGDTVLDIGAGAGNDSLIAAGLVGSAGRVIALDLTPAMTATLYHAAQAGGCDNVAVVQGSAERLPLSDGSVDVVTSNGALNLVPDKRRAVAEMFRVLRPGGRLQMADVVIRRPVTVDCGEDPRLWVECVVGATVDEELLHLFREAGFEAVEVLRRHDYFAHSPSAQTREIAESFGAHSLDLGMRRAATAPSTLQRWLWRADPRHWLAALRRRGFLGVAALLLALLSCYGTLAALALLPLLGYSLAVDEGAWAVAIAAFALLTLAAVAAGVRRHGRWAVVALAATGVSVILYALFIQYSLVVELAGFLLLAGGVVLDAWLRRRHQARVLGLEAAPR
ncbi:MerC family mercury resistance protein [Alkalilimnicola ehrlichii MLHE-1]|uniref:Methyltransferase type 11 n=1 Tax=Alkalilimnicola ehrlichii (strain ATCC BAA-1101 / DSM 17681 / MLHE-1) TaxID=187272 RepID=Q0A858_ALKEH|nr:MerC family mercury resistance protein [Alkalilimnicola ehrlichii]ABI56979.1 Methyltransferase type 11 [Alkalilimnicola ehrlichii MLHE-1]